MKQADNELLVARWSASYDTPLDQHILEQPFILIIRIVKRMN